MTETARAVADESAIASLYRVWTVLLADLKPLIEPDAEAPEEAVLPKLEAAWALEHLIASTRPESLDDVRLKAIVVKHWMKDASTERIIDELLDSLTQLPGKAA